MTQAKKASSNMHLLRLAWSATGGTAATIRSAEFWLAIFVWAVCAHFWLYDYWYDQVISVLPNIIGFTLSGFAIVVSFGDDSFRKMLVHEEEDKNVYLSVSSAFLMFVSFQIIALLYAYMAKATYFKTPTFLLKWKCLIQFGDVFFSGLGYLLFIYSFTLALKATLRVFRLSRWYNGHMLANKGRGKELKDGDI